jgi:hypothetical protein
MSAIHWKPLKGTDFTALREARLQAHYAAQWLARSARAYIDPQPDDSHTSLGWDDGLDGFTTHALKMGNRIGLRIPDLTLALIHDGKITQSFPLYGRSEAEARAWLGKQMQALGLAAEALDTPLPYELSEHELGQDGRYGQHALAEALRELAAWYADGAAALNAIRQRLIARGLPAPVVRCWPHHFDLDCLTVIGNGAAYVVPTMGAGFSPGDHYYDEPYFYISLYPRPDASRLPTLPPPGHWHMQDFLAALLPASRILALNDPPAGTEMFLFAASDTIAELLQSEVARPAQI